MYQLAEKKPVSWILETKSQQVEALRACLLFVQQDNTICYMYRKNMLAITVTLAFIRLGILAMIPTLLLYFLAFTELKNLL